jgi:hypothetical protein
MVVLDKGKERRASERSIISKSNETEPNNKHVVPLRTQLSHAPNVPLRKNRDLLLPVSGEHTTHDTEREEMPGIT